MSARELRDLASSARPTARAEANASDLKTLLALGTARVARDLFRHDPPTAGEIERAIDLVEDALMRAGMPAAGGGALISSAPALQPWAAVSGPTMTVEIVEQWFQRLALASHGQTGALQGLPAGREAAATLLVLREFMHHRGYASITVADPRQTLVDLPTPA